MPQSCCFIKQKISAFVVKNESSVVLIHKLSLVSYSCQMAPTEQMESNLQSEKDICSDIEGIIQLDGTGDVSPKEEIPHKDREENLFVGINESEDLKVLEDNEDNDEECDSVSNTESSTSGGDEEELQADIVEEVTSTFMTREAHYNGVSVLSVELFDPEQFLGS